MSIDDLRRRIDEIDEQLVTLLNERSTCALEVGRLKRELGIEVYQPDREAEVHQHARSCSEQNGGPLDAGAIRRIFERIIDEARHIEREIARASSTPAGPTRT